MTTAAHSHVMDPIKAAERIYAMWESAQQAQDSEAARRGNELLENEYAREHEAAMKKPEPGVK